MGVYEPSQADSTTDNYSKVLVSQESYSRMKISQLKRPINLIDAPPAAEESIKKMRNSFVLEELKNGSAFRTVGKNSRVVIKEPLLSIIDPRAQYELAETPYLQDVTNGTLPVDIGRLEGAIKNIG